MSQRNEVLDFSGLFKLDVLLHLDVCAYSFYELGLKKFLALSSKKELVFLYINYQGERFDHHCDWDFVDNPIYSLCFEPSGTWLLIVSADKLLLVPFLPLFTPQNDFDHKWSLTSVTVLPLGDVGRPTCVTWWLTKESDNILIIGSKIGIIAFYSLESQTIVGESKICDEVSDLQICFDDSLDLLTLLITGAKSQQWKLILEHRSFGYNWLQQTRGNPDLSKRDSFMSVIKDKITMLTLGTSKGNRPQEYVLKPTEYLPAFRKGSNNWALTAQYVNGRHFLTAFETNEGTTILESPEQDVPSRTLRPLIKKDGQYAQGLWSHRLIYLLRKNELEVHSCAFSVIQGEGLHGSRDQSLLWSAELIGTVHCAYLVSTREPAPVQVGWKEPTFMCDLQLPRFNLEQCLIITTSGAYLLNTVSDPSEWLVGVIMRGGGGGGGAEQAAAALGAALPPLLRAASDMLLARGRLAPAHYLYSLAQSPPDGWVARLGVFNRLQEVSMYKPATATEGSLGNQAITIRLLSILLKMANNFEEEFDSSIKLVTLTVQQLEELCGVSAALGLWDMVPVFSIHRGKPSLFLNAMRLRGELCRGALNCLVRQRCIVPMLLQEDAQWFFDFIAEKCNKMDTRLLKCICLWLCPLQDQLRPVMRDLKQGITNVYTKRLQHLITTFMLVAAAIEAREPSPQLNPELPQQSEPRVNTFVPQRALSCGLSHWAVADEGDAKIMFADTPVNTGVIGRVISVACGRHHTLVLTENGVYSCGDNSYGQGGVGTWWRGGAGEAASAAGALLHVPLPAAAAAAAVAAGHYHSAALDLAGRLYTWGWGVHGQLGHGTIDDVWSPMLVTKLQGRKIVSVGCGACHTVVLTMNGSVYTFGASVFGQLGTGGRDKSCVPVLVAIPDPVVQIAVGYFHNLALSRAGCVWLWGGSPKAVRAGHARRPPPPPAPSPSPAAPDPAPHLAPVPVDFANVRGNIVQMSAGWHHSCIVNNAGQLYTWGLNFNGQLGIGDRKQVVIPTEIKITRETPVDSANEQSTNVTNKHETDIESMTTKAMVACGGDFTIFIDDDGWIYSAGNDHLESTKEISSKLADRVIMMKTTKRVIKIPSSRTNNKCLVFSPIDRVELLFPFDIEGKNRSPIVPQQSPLTKLSDFKRKTWPDEVIFALKPWIQEDLISNNNMAAKLAYQNKKYSTCLKLLLDNLKSTSPDDILYVTHSENSQEQNKDFHSLQRDELKIAITNLMSKRIKEISLSVLNEVSYPTTDPIIYKTIPCCCDELKYLTRKIKPTPVANMKNQDLSIQAANVIDKTMGLFPIDSELWETCFRCCKNFYLENNLLVNELETVLRKYMQMNASAMATAIMYSNDCVQYNKILSPKFYLNMCSEIMDAWT